MVLKFTELGIIPFKKDVADEIVGSFNHGVDFYGHLTVLEVIDIFRAYAPDHVKFDCSIPQGRLIYDDLVLPDEVIEKSKCFDIYHVVLPAPKNSCAIMEQ